jgi:hypothetical protein
MGNAMDGDRLGACLEEKCSLSVRRMAFLRHAMRPSRGLSTESPGFDEALR